MSNGTIGYIDIIYFKEHEIVVIEIKREAIIKKDLSQLSEYVHCIKKLYPGKIVRGILIGQYLDDNLKVFLDLMGLTFKSYFYDIPLRLKICDKCRKVVGINQNNCNWCNSEDFLPF